MGLSEERRSSGEEPPMVTSDNAPLPAQKLTSDHTERMLKGRHVQLLGIGGVIGTLVFVSIGKTLMVSGPGSLLVAFAFW